MSHGLLLVTVLLASPHMEPAASPSEAGAPASTAAEPGDDWVDLRLEGVRLTVDLTPTLHQLLPPEPDEPAGAEVHEGGRLSFFVLPDVRYNPDEGLGLGLAIPIVWTEPGLTPYKYSFVFQLVTSTKLVQDQALLYDLVRLFGLPLRLSGQAGFYAFADEPYCGVGSVSTCDPAQAEHAAQVRGLSGEEAEEQIERYYLMRLVRPYNWSILRLQMFDWLGTWELFGGLRSEWYFPGFFGNVLEGQLFESGPYEGSLFEKRDDKGEPGWVNVAQAGIMVDSRDFEPSPRTGYWLEASVRGAHPLALSKWGFAGMNVTGRLYVPLLPSKTLTLATRVIADVIVGDAPVQELARFGGSMDYRGFGGRWVGRGMRQQRFIGNVKLAYQSELRWDALRFDVGGFSLGFEFVGFLDAGVVLADGVDYTLPVGLQRPLRPLLTWGVGLRWVINKTIVVRADVGVSPDEGLAPQFYFDGRHIF